MTQQGWRRWLPWVTGAVVLLAAVLIFNVLRQLSLEQVTRSLEQVNAERLGRAALCILGSYVTLTGFDWLGTRHAGATIGYPRVALASFTSLSIGHTVGLSPFSSGAVRYRFYTRWSLTAGQVATIVLSSATTVALGELALASVALLVRPELAARLLHIDPALARLIGGGGAFVLAGWVTLSIFLRRPLRIARWSIALPPWRIAAAQIVVGAINFGFVAGALHAVLGPSLDYFTVATAYILGNLAALISHVPGGIGVLEAVMLGVLPHADVIGPLIAFRVMYFFVPLALGLLLLGGIELGLRVRPDAAAAADNPG